MVLTRTSETVPVVDGKMQLGTWQGIFLFEHRRAPHRRKIFVTIMGEMLPLRCLPRRSWTKAGAKHYGRIRMPHCVARLTEAQLQISRPTSPAGHRMNLAKDSGVTTDTSGSQGRNVAPPRKLPGDGAARDSLPPVEDLKSRLNPHCG